MKSSYLILLSIIIVLSSCEQNDWSEDTTSVNNDSLHNIGGKAICFWNITNEGWLPDLSCSPGKVNPNCTKENICTPGYTKTVRNVTQKKKEQVYINYGVLTRTTGEYEMDHIIPLELCGSNDIENLYPQPAEPILGFKQKDRLENLANDLVCAGEETLKDAQIKISSNWIEYYHEVIE